MVDVCFARSRGRSPRWPCRRRLCASGPAAIAIAAAAQPQAPSWAAPQIASVVLAGVMGPSVVAFRPDDPLTREELHEAIVALGKPHQAPTDPTRIVTMRELDAQLVAAAGLLPCGADDPARGARRRASIRRTCSAPRRSRASSGCASTTRREARISSAAPKQPASRAEAAYSLAKLRLLDPARIAADPGARVELLRPDADRPRSATS